MSVYRREGSPYYTMEFIIGGKRIKESTKAKTKTMARDVERQRRLELEKALAGIPSAPREKRIRSVQDLVKEYLEDFAVNHRAKTVVNARGRLAHVVRVLGTTLAPDLDEKALRRYIAARLKEGASGRTINMEVGELSRAIGRTWKDLWPKLKKLDERTDVGKALSSEEEARLLSALDSTKSQLGGTFVRVALYTGMRHSEILGLTWKQVAFESSVVTVGRSKTTAGTGREIPMNNDLFALLTTHRDWYVSKFGETKPDSYVFPYGSPKPSDPTRPATTMKTYWDSVRKAAGVQCRFHDLRHTVATKMAEADVPESTMKALLGHMSRAMLERYSHVRIKAKRQAVVCLQSSANAAEPVPPPKVPPLTSPAAVN